MPPQQSSGNRFASMAILVAMVFAIGIAIVYFRQTLENETQGAAPAGAGRTPPQTNQLAAATPAPAATPQLPAPNPAFIAGSATPLAAPPKPTDAPPPAASAAPPIPTAAATPSAARTPEAALKPVVVTVRLLAPNGAPAAGSAEVFFATYETAGAAPQFRTQRLSGGATKIEFPRPVEVIDIGLAESATPTGLVQTVNAAEATEATVDLRLPGTVTLRGRVLGAGGTPVPSMPITVARLFSAYGSGSPPPSRPEVLGRSADDGSFELLALAAPTLRIAVAGDSTEAAPFLPGAPIELGFMSLEDSIRSDLQIVLERGEVLEGTAKSAAALPLREVTIELDGPMKRTGRVDAAGAFRVEGLARGYYSVTMRAGGHAPREMRNVQVPSAPMKVELEPLAEVRGAIGFADGPAPEGATSVTVALRGSGLWRTQTISATPRAPLEFAFADLPSGEQDIVAVVQSGTLWWVGRLDVTLAPGERMNGRTVTASPLVAAMARLVGVERYKTAELEVLVEDQARAEQPAGLAWLPPPGLPEPAATITEGGALRIVNVERGRDYLVSIRERGSRSVVGGAVLRGGDAGDPPPIVLGGTGTVVGAVRNQNGGACANVEVELVSNLAVFGTETPRLERRRTKTDFEGRFRFQSVPSGRARVVLGGDDATTRYISVASGGTLELTLSCMNTVLTRFAFKAPDDRPIAADEVFIVMSRSGTKTPETMKEISGPDATVELPPGEFSILRAATMQSQNFSVGGSIEKPIEIDYTKYSLAPMPTASPIATPATPAGS